MSPQKNESDLNCSRKNIELCIHCISHTNQHSTDKKIEMTWILKRI